jgi:hypothetical protein
MLYRNENICSNALKSRYLQNIPAGIEDKEGAYVSLSLSVGVCACLFFAAIMQELTSAARVLVSY